MPSKTINLDGIIGLDTEARDIRAQMPESGAIDLRINTPGGLVDEGIAIANELRAFRRKGGTVNATVSGQCCSIGTYIAMFADRLEVEDNAVWMLHNPSTIARGDHRLMAKTAQTLESVRAVLCRAYTARTARDTDAIHSEMDEETWLFGEEIVTAGYADAIVPAGDGPESGAEAVALARNSFSAMLAKLKQREADPAQIDQIAAILPLNPPEHNAMAENAKTAPAAEDQTEPLTDPEAAEEQTEQAADPSVVQAAVQAALSAERQRIAAINARCHQVSMPQIAQALIDAGSDMAACNAAIVDAYVAQGGQEIKQTTDAATTATQSDPSDAQMQSIQRRIMAQVSGAK